MTSDSTIILYLVFWFFGFGILGGLIYQNKGGSFASGFWLGALLGLLGVLIAALSTPGGSGGQRATRECPHCKEAMRRDASVCPHCQRNSEPWIFHENRWWVKRESGDYFLDEKTGNWTLFTDTK